MACKAGRQPQRNVVPWLQPHPAGTAQCRSSEVQVRGGWKGDWATVLVRPSRVDEYGEKTGRTYVHGNMASLEVPAGVPDDVSADDPRGKVVDRRESRKPDDLMARKAWA